jgi:adenylyltransferase/sulfurtransferase
MNPLRRRTASRKTIIVVGAGGNIGSHLVAHLGRMPFLGRVVLIDRDRYEPKNLLSQEIEPRDVGKPKAIVQAGRLRRINPGLQVCAISEAVQNVPVGLLRADLILAGLDSRGARQYVNQVAWRLGIPWIDAGVKATGLLTRVSVYEPGADAPCIECGWDDERIYEQLEQVYPCQDGPDDVPPTEAPSFLGALAASQQAIECAKLLGAESPRRDGSAVEVVLDAEHHQLYRTVLRRNPACRFDHGTWRAIRQLRLGPKHLTVGQALDLGKPGRGQAHDQSISLEGAVFAKKLTCRRCGEARNLLYLLHRIRPRDRMCSRCGKEMTAAGIDRKECLERSDITGPIAARRLWSLGFRTGDICTVGKSSYFELGSG